MARESTHLYEFQQITGKILRTYLAAFAETVFRANQGLMSARASSLAVQSSSARERTEWPCTAVRVHDGCGRHGNGAA